MRKSAYIKPSVEIVLLSPSHVMNDWSVPTGTNGVVEEEDELSKRHALDFWDDDLPRSGGLWADDEDDD